MPLLLIATGVALACSPNLPTNCSLAMLRKHQGFVGALQVEVLRVPAKVEMTGTIALAQQLAAQM
jgi:hypothetical protein